MYKTTRGGLVRKRERVSPVATVAIIIAIFALLFNGVLIYGMRERGPSAGDVMHQEQVYDRSHDGSYTLEPGVTFESDPIPGGPLPQMWTSSHGFTPGLAHINYDWVIAPESSYRIYGEILDANGNSIRRKEGTDTGMVSVEIYPSDRERGATFLAVQFVWGATGNQGRSDFIPIDWNKFAAAPATAPAPAPAPAPVPAITSSDPTQSPAPAPPQDSGDGESQILDPNVSWD